MLIYDKNKFYNEVLDFIERGKLEEIIPFLKLEIQPYSKNMIAINQLVYILSQNKFPLKEAYKVYKMYPHLKPKGILNEVIELNKLHLTRVEDLREDLTFLTGKAYNIKLNKESLVKELHKVLGIENETKVIESERESFNVWLEGIRC